MAEVVEERTGAPLEREVVAMGETTVFYGLVTKWLRKYGWLVPLQDLEDVDEELSKHGGSVFVHKSDVVGKGFLVPGSIASFSLYRDSSGLGGSDCTPCSACRLLVPDADAVGMRVKEPSFVEEVKKATSSVVRIYSWTGSEWVRPDSPQAAAASAEVAESFPCVLVEVWGPTAEHIAATVLHMWQAAEGDAATRTVEMLVPETHMAQLDIEVMQQAHRDVNIAVTAEWIVSLPMACRKFTAIGPGDACRQALATALTQLAGPANTTPIAPTS